MGTRDKLANREFAPPEDFVLLSVELEGADVADPLFL